MGRPTIGKKVKNLKTSDFESIDNIQNEKISHFEIFYPLFKIDENREYNQPYFHLFNISIKIQLET